MTPEFSIIVPCHHASRRLPGKLLLEIGGKPVMGLAIGQALKTGAKVVAALSDGLLAQAAADAGAEHAVTGEHPSGTARAAALAESKGMEPGHIVVIVQADEPFILPSTITAVADALRDRPDAACATAARPLKDGEYEDPNTVKVVVDSDGLASYFSRAPIPFNRERPGAPPPEGLAHLGIYAYRVRHLLEYARAEPAPAEKTEKLEQLRLLWLGRGIAVAVTDDDSFGIDTEADLDRARRRVAAHG